MNRKNFIRKGILGIGSIVALPTAFVACDKNEDDTSSDCNVSPKETNGPYPIITPSALIKSSIVGDRTGVALLMTFTVQDKSQGCTPLAGVYVDVWHCDKDGNYSQYGSYSSANFLRGRQTTDANGRVTFLTIFPGWYSSRAPHIHLEVLSSTGISLLVTQIAFPVTTYTEIYASSEYNGNPDTPNSADGIFSDSLSSNMADSITGNITDGYTMLKTITVS